MWFVASIIQGLESYNSDDITQHIHFLGNFQAIYQVKNFLPF